MSDQLLLQGTCEVWADGALKGTGWLAFTLPGVANLNDPSGSVERHYVVTAGHLMTEASCVRVRFPFPQDCVDESTATIIYREWNAKDWLDCAVLRLDKPKLNRRPLRIAWLDGLQEGASIRAYGFGGGLPGAAPGSGEYVGIFPQPSTILFRLRSQELAMKGYSGAAIWSEQAGGVVAFQTSANVEFATKPFAPDTVIAFPLSSLATRAGFLQALPGIRLVEGFPNPPNAGSLDPQKSPYVGPRPYRYDERDNFFGRARDTANLIKLMESSSKILVYGPSGAGKSSLLATRIHDVLQLESACVYSGLRAGVPGTEAQTHQKTESYNPFVASILSSLSGQMPGRPVEGDATLASFLQADSRKRVLVIDQGEELFLKFDLYWKKRFEFFSQVEAALQVDRRLQFVFVIRQEYLAEFEHYARGSGKDWSLYRISPLTVDAAKSAVLEPARRLGIEWEPAQVDAIVEELSSIRRTFSMPAGERQAVQVPGEFVPLIQLQIVCDDIWRKLPRGINLITEIQIAQAVGAQESNVRPALGTFVSDALVRFYSNALKTAAVELVGGESEKSRALESLLNVGCFQFVNNNRGRVLIRYDKDHDRLGRLREKWVRVLETQQVIQMIERGGEQWYELSHDRLAEAIDRRKKEDIAAMQLSQKLRILEGEVETTGGTKKETSAGFVKSSIEIADFSSRQLDEILYQDEIQHLLRSSLTTGGELEFWASYLRDVKNPALESIVGDALVLAKDAGERTVVVNALSLISLCPALLDRNPGWSGTLIALLQNSRCEVSDATAECVAIADRDGLYGILRSQILISGGWRWLKSLALVHFKHDWIGGDRGRLRNCVSRIGYKNIMRLWPLLIVLRLKFGGRYVLLAALFTGLISAVLTALARATFGAFSPTIMNAWNGRGPGVGQGLFHGLAGGAIWGTSVATCIVGFWIIQGGALRRRSWASTLFCGVTGGFVGGLLLMSIVLSVYEPASVHDAGWITSRLANSEINNHSRWVFTDRLKESWFNTRTGLYYPFLGLALGGCVAVGVFKQMSLSAWEDAVTEDQKRFLKQALRKQVWRDLGCFVSIIAAAWALGCCTHDDREISLKVPSPEPSATAAEKTISLSGTNLPMHWIMTFDSLTVFVGGCSIYLGLVVALYVARVGTSFESEAKVFRRLRAL